MPIPADGVLVFMELGPYSFSPTNATLVVWQNSSDDSGADWAAISSNTSDCGISVSQQSIDLFYPIRVQTWTIAKELLSRASLRDGTAGALKLRVLKNWTDENVHPYWLQVITLDDTTVLAAASTLRRRQAGKLLAGLPAAVRDKSFTAEFARTQQASVADPVLTGLPERELTDRDVAVESAAYPKAAMKIAFAPRHSTVSPMFAYNSGVFFTMNNANAFAESSSGHQDTWAYPGLLVDNAVVTPAPVSASTSWERSASSGRSVPIFRIDWATEEVNVTQRLSSQLVGGVPMGVAHFRIRAISANVSQVRFIVAVGRKPGVRDFHRDLIQHWGQMRAWNSFDVVDEKTSSMVVNGACATAGQPVPGKCVNASCPAHQPYLYSDTALGGSYCCPVPTKYGTPCRVPSTGREFPVCRSTGSTKCACCLVAGTKSGTEGAAKCEGAPTVPAGSIVCRNVSSACMRGAIALLSTAQLSLHSKGLTETRYEVTLPGSLQGIGSTADFYLALPQGEICWGNTSDGCTARLTAPLPGQTDFEHAEKAMILGWDEMFESTPTRFHFPSAYWQQHADIWTAAVQSLGRIGNTTTEKSRLEYGAGEVYGDDFEGVEEGWEPRAMDYFGYTAEAQRETEIFLDPAGNLNREIKGSQYRNGLAQHYAYSHALLSGDAAWLRSVAPTLISNTNWTAQQRLLGYRDNQTAGLLPKKFYDSSDVRIPAFPVYSNVACWRGADDTAFLLSIVGGVRPTTQAILRSEALNYREDLISTLCREANTSVKGEVFMPLSLEIGTYNGTGPKPPNEQPYAFVPNLANKLSDYWSLWYNLVLHLGMFQFDPKHVASGTGGTTDPWSGACKQDGTRAAGLTIMPDSILTNWGEAHGGLWGGLPRFYSGLDAVYHGWCEHAIGRAAASIAWRQRALAAVEAYMMHAVSFDGFSSAEVTPLFPRQFNRTSVARDAEMAPWMVYMYAEMPLGQDVGELSDVLPAGAAAGLCILRKAMLLETVTPPSPHPDGGLVLLPVAPANFLAVAGAEVKLVSVPTAYGLVDFEAQQAIAGTVTVSFRYALHKGGLLVPLTNVSARLVVPGGKGVRGPGGCVQVDAWTIGLPVTVITPGVWYNFSVTVLHGGMKSDDEALVVPSTVLHVDSRAAKPGDGSESTPFATIKAAQMAVRALAPSVRCVGVAVQIEPGIYTASATTGKPESDGPWEFGRADSGCRAHCSRGVSCRAAKLEMRRLSRLVLSS